ncbi:hypothetical protein J132_03683 [Termitomyces sp. J132]|nr:hypothetical protein J132_03683 [Termitomyces sp. J132]
MWLQWFKTAGSGVEWLELVTIERECCQLYEWYKGEEWVLVDPLLEFLMDNLMVGMMVSAPVVTSTSDTAKHLVGALAVARGEGRSKGHEDDEAADRRDIQAAGPSTPKAAAGGVARGLAMSPRLATTPRSKGKGKGKAQDEEDEDTEDQIEETFTDKCLAILLHWRKALTVVDTGMGARVKLEKAKGKVMVSLEKRQEYKCMQGACDNCWADNNPEGCCNKGGISKECKGFHGVAEGVGEEEAEVGGSGGAKVKSRAIVESDKDGSNNNGDDLLLVQKRPASPSLVASAKRPQTIARKEGGEDVEMKETTLLAMVTKVEREASNMEVKGEEVEVVPVAAEEEERAEEVERNWSDTLLHQVGDDELEWLGKDLGWPTPLMAAVSLMDFNKRVAGVE